MTAEQQKRVTGSPYLQGVLKAMAAALARRLPIERWAVFVDDAGSLQRVASDGRAPTRLDEERVQQVLASGQPLMLRAGGGDSPSTAVLAVPLSFEQQARFCFYGEIDAALEPDALGDFDELARGCADIAGAAVEAISSLRGLIEEASEGVIVADTQGNYTDVNRAACEIIGYSREELLRLNYRDLLSTQEVEGLPIQYQRLFAGETVRIERRLVRKEGDEVVTELSGKLTSDGRFVALARDVTERRRTEQALRESEERYRTLTESAFEAIGIHDGHVWLEVNPALARTIDCTPEQLIGRPVRDLVNPEEWERIERIPREARERPFEATAPRADGENVHYEVCAKTVPYQGRMVRLVAARAITARKEAEAELRRLAAERHRMAAKVIEAQEQERLTLARELHDHVGQVLAVLKMDAAWLSKQATRPDEVQSVAERIDANAEEMLRVVRDLSYKLRPAVLDDLGLGCAIESLVREVAARSSISFEVDIDAPPKLSQEVTIALYRIAQEALTNVIRHAGALRCRVTMQAQNGHIELGVEHDGRAVSRAVLDDGAAIGITGMRERSTLLGGEFVIEPRHGGGTMLSAKIPLDATSASTPTPAARRRTLVG